MAFNFFGLRKRPVIQDVEVKVPSPSPTAEPMTFDEMLAAAQAANPDAAVVKAQAPQVTEVAHLIEVAEVAVLPVVPEVKNIAPTSS